MPNYRSSHNYENIKREITAIIRELKDPRLKSGFISVVKISTSHDASSCRVFISALEGIEKSEEAVKILSSASGYIRKELGERLHLRYVPNLTFIPTDAVEYGINMSKKIDDILSK
jgi:ribosome-binding factor A